MGAWCLQVRRKHDSVPTGVRVRCVDDLHAVGGFYLGIHVAASMACERRAMATKMGIHSRCHIGSHLPRKCFVDMSTANGRPGCHKKCTVRKISFSRAVDVESSPR